MAIVRFSEVGPKRVSWLWEGRIAREAITVIDGDAGVGKSTLTLNITAAVSTGRPLPGSAGYEWFTAVFENGDTKRWSAYAAELYERLRDKARREGWINKLRYFLYEGDICEADAAAFAGLEGVLLQSKPGPDGLSKNPHIAGLQRTQ